MNILYVLLTFLKVAARSVNTYFMYSVIPFFCQNSTCFIVQNNSYLHLHNTTTRKFRKNFCMIHPCKAKLLPDSAI